MTRLAAPALRMAMAATLAMGLSAPALAQGGIVTFTFDDASRTQYEVGLPVIREFDLPGTLFVISGKANEAARLPGAWGMDWREIAEFRDAGWEIGAHTDTHPDLTQLADDRVALELEVSRDEIVAHLGVTPVSFASPFGEYDDRTLAQIMQRFSYHTGAYGGAEGRETSGKIDPARISRMNVDETVGAGAVCSQAQQTARDGGWLVLMFHGFEPNNPVRFQTTPRAFRRMVECTTELRKAGQLRILTLREAMETLRPR